TLPLARIVSTFSRPRASSAARRSAILIVRPPTLTPRSSAIQCLDSATAERLDRLGSYRPGCLDPHAPADGRGRTAEPELPTHDQGEGVAGLVGSEQELRIVVAHAAEPRHDERVGIN